MTLKQHYKTNFLLAYPVMISMLGQVMTGVADSIMIGRTGATPLAASSLANVVFMLLLTFGIGVSYAITPLVAEADGRQDKKSITEILRHGFIINLVTGFILLTIILLTGPLLHYINQPIDVVALAIPYLFIISLSIVPFMVFQTFRQFGEGLHSTRMAMIIVITCNLLNILLNYLLIYGKYGFPELGLNGAGWATLISRVLMGILMLAYIFCGKKFISYRNGFAFGNYSRKLINKMLNIGIPAGIQFIFEVSAFGFSAIMMGWIGTTALAAHQIAINLATISYMTTSGLGAAATIRVGSYLGKRDIPTLRMAGFTLIGMALIVMTIWGIAFIIWRHELPLLYIDDQSVVAIAAPLLIIAGLFQLSDGMQVVCAGALRGLQDVKIPSLMIFVAYWVISLPLGYWLGFKLNYGANGIWMGLLIGLTITATAMFIRFATLSKKLLPNSVSVE
ncbi:MAG: MATE family efflux transporter [Cyclobacteriaceae bacterium]|nr:MATE family efflux transporter [Cyclobacteriaceae bacterium]UYN87467.1 MAG: MATE family efflux transporter [Cyclobacteriaceae bacterium]